jgi:hypothetical protein
MAARSCLGARRAGRLHHDAVAPARLPPGPRRRFRVREPPATARRVGSAEHEPLPASCVRQRIGACGDRRWISQRRVPQACRGGRSRPGSLPADWHDILAALKISGMARELAQHCELRDLAGARIVLRLSPAHRHLLMKPAQDKLQQSLGRAFCQAVAARPSRSKKAPAIHRRRRHSGTAASAWIAPSHRSSRMASCVRSSKCSTPP